MSYCRWGESDLYIIHNTYGFLECFCADGKDKISWKTNNRQEMIDHIEKHRNEGAIISEHAINRLEKEIKEEGVLVR